MGSEAPLTHEKPRATWFDRPGGELERWWRCTIPARALPGEVVTPRGTFPGTGPVVARTTVVIDYCLLVEELHREGRRVVLDFDDDIDAEFLFLYRQRSVPAPGSLETYRRSLKAAAAIADGVTVGTEVLAERWRPYARNVYLCRNAIDPAQWGVTHDRDETFRVGFSGSTTHVDDLELIRDALAWASAQPGVEVHVFGVDPTGRSQFEMVGARPRSAEDQAERQRTWRFPYTHHPAVETIAEHVANIALLDVGLAPVIPTSWGITRSDAKLLEYAMAGALPIVSDVEPYREWRGRVPMATGAEEFTRHVRWAVEHPDEARTLAAEIRAEVLARRTIERTIGEWRDALALGVR